MMKNISPRYSCRTKINPKCDSTASTYSRAEKASQKAVNHNLESIENARIKRCLLQTFGCVWNKEAQADTFCSKQIWVGKIS